MSAISIVSFMPGGNGGLKVSALALAEPGCRCSVRLRCLPGADAIHLALRDDTGVLLRAEIEADGDELVLVEIELDSEERLQVTSRNRRVLTLPPDDTYAPAPPIVPSQTQEALDLALVIDGTARIFTTVEQDGEDEQDEEGEKGEEDQLSGQARTRELRSQPLLQNGEHWPAMVRSLQELLTAMAGLWPDNRLALMAFGDQKVPLAAAHDLQPAYLLYPRQPAGRSLQPLSIEQMVSELQGIPPSSGGDLVDALADALHACSELRWRHEARKVVIVLGDSPGHSVLTPVPKGGDGCIRHHDVDVEAARLHRLGVELLTIYLDPPESILHEALESKRRLLEHTREQYRRLASLPSLAMLSSGLVAETTAQLLRQQTDCLGRGPALGELLAIGGATDEATGPPS